MARSSTSSAMSALACRDLPPPLAELEILSLQLASQMFCLWSQCRTSPSHCMPSLHVAWLTKALICCLLSCWCLLPAEVLRWDAAALPAAEVINVARIAIQPRCL